MLSKYDRAALHFGLENLETRRLLAVTASVNASHVLVIAGTSGNDTIVLNKISNGKVTVSGVATQFSPGATAGKFNKISINAGNGNDSVQINNNVPYLNSTISGSGGTDTLTGGSGNDSIDGDNQNDTLSGGGGGADLLRGDAGFDTANYSDRTDNLTISLDNAANDGGNGGAEGDNVQTEEVIAGAGNDTLNGSEGDDFLAGGGGADVIHGNGGNDDITGSSGSDQLLGDEGDDFIQAKNNDVDSVSGGNNVGGVDLASVDNIDVPASVAQRNQIRAERAAALAAVVSNASTVPGGSSNSPSDLDTTYGTGGKAVGPDLGWDQVNAAAVDSQGRVVFVGTDFRFAGSGYGDDMVATRYNADGTPDTNFGNNGEAVINFPTGSGYGYGYGSPVSQDVAHGVAIGSGDSIVVVGSSFIDSNVNNDALGVSLNSGPDSVFAIAKLTSAGALDTSFGTGGYQTVNLTTDSSDPRSSTARDVAIQSDGNIVIGGDTTRVNQQVTYDPAADFSADNNPDGPFSYGYSTTLDGDVTLYDTHAVAPDGTDVWTSSQLVNTTTYAPDVQHNGTGESTNELDDGQLALEPGFYGQFSHVTFTAPTSGTYDIDGSFDPTRSGGDGTPTVDVHVLVNGEDLAPGTLPDDESSAFDLPGQFLNAGDKVEFVVGYGSDQNFTNDITALSAEITRTSAPDDQQLAVARLTAQGALDGSFNGGFNSVSVGDSVQASSVALQSLSDDGSQQVVIGGTADGHFAVARFSSDGSLDGNFGDNGGYTTTDINEESATLNDLAVDSNNNIVAVGTVGDNTSGAAVALGKMLNSNFATIVKYDSEGSFLKEKDYLGQSQTLPPSWNAVSINSQDRILVAGDDVQDYIVGRYTSSLDFDTTFASNPVAYDLKANDGSHFSLDSAVVVKELTNHKIIAAGSSFIEDANSNFHLETSAIRLIGTVSTTTNPFGIEEFVNDIDFNNPPADLVPHLQNISPSALLYLESQPDQNGDVTIDSSKDGVTKDKITLTTEKVGDGSLNVVVTVNGIKLYYDAGTTHSIKIIVDDGNDTVESDNSVKTELIIYGGKDNDVLTGGGGTNIIFGADGDDIINGGSGPDIIVGGNGKDKITGNDGRDILIGGTGADSLNGAANEDILIGGSTAYDTNLTALRALIAEWSSNHSNATRISNLKSGSSGGLNDPFYLRGTGSGKTVIDDNAIDSLSGGSSRDWFFRKTTGSNKDVLNDSLPSEEFSAV